MSKRRPPTNTKKRPAASSPPPPNKASASVVPPPQQAGQVIPISNAMLQYMLKNQAPQQAETNVLTPGSPLMPYAGATPKYGPRQYAYQIGSNLTGPDRSFGNADIPSFPTLRRLARTYSGISLCERVILDMIPRLVPQIHLRPDLIAQGMQEKDYQPEISAYLTFFEKPDRVHDHHSWLRMAWKEQTQLDALAMYKHPTRSGSLYALEILDGALIKPLLDERGMPPQPPYPAYQQYVYGVPAGLYTSDQIRYYRESPSADTPYGFSRVERIIIEVNQALRKKAKDLARYTEGNVPAGIMQVPAAANWTPDQIDAYEQMWNALLAGNAQQQVRVKFTQPGMTYVRIDDVELNTPFDEFLLNIAAASYGLSMQDLAFTGDIHKSSSDAQQNVLFRRTLYPLVSVYAAILTEVLRTDFHDDRFIFTYGGFEEAEDISALATAYSTLTNAGILGLSNAAKLLKLPEDPGARQVGRVIITKDGPIFVDDLADPKMRAAQEAAQLASYQQATQPPPAPASPALDDPEAPDGGKNPPSGGTQPPAPGKSTSGAKQPAPPATKAAPAMLARAAQTAAHTGVMVGFFLDPYTARLLALPDGEPPEALHVTLAFLCERDDSADYNPLRQALSRFASEQQPFGGQVSGLACFQPNDDGITPLVALVNSHGIQAFRQQLVDRLALAGFPVDTTYAYMPHITLDYLEPGEPVPVGAAPPVKLLFDSLMLAVSDDHTDFLLRPGPPSGDPGPAAGPGLAGEESPLPSLYDAVPSVPDERAVSAEYRRWRTRAIEDVKAGRAQRGFATTLISADEHAALSAALATCTMPDEVRTVFERARARHSAPLHNDITAQVATLFQQAASRGARQLAAVENQQ